MPDESITQATQTIHTAMTLLRAGEIRTDQFRAIMHASKQEHGQAAHERARDSAVAASNR